MRHNWEPRKSAESTDFILRWFASFVVAAAAITLGLVFLDVAQA